MADDQVLTACVWGGRCTRVCVHPHIHMYGNTVDREAGYSTAKRAKMLLKRFLLEFHSNLKGIFFFLFCVTSICLCLFHCLFIRLSIPLQIYQFFAVW